MLLYKRGRKRKLSPDRAALILAHLSLSLFIKRTRSKTFVLQSIDDLERKPTSHIRSEVKNMERIIVQLPTF